MNLNELAKKFQIKNETFHAVKKVEEMTGKSIRFELVDDLSSHGLLKAARERMEEHIIYLSNRTIENINHIIIHECHHIFRLWSVDEEQRVNLSRNQEGVDERIRLYKKEVGKRAEMYPPNVFEAWDKGLITLLFNAITDTRIEFDIYHDYPGIRDEQLRSLKAMENSIKQSVGKEIKQMTAKTVYENAAIMNYVFLMRLSPIIGKSWRKAYKGQTEISKKGVKLLRMIPEEDKGLIQDVELINKWAVELEIKGINWTPFNNVPIGYEYSY